MYCTIELDTEKTLNVPNLPLVSWAYRRTSCRHQTASTSAPASAAHLDSRCDCKIIGKQQSFQGILVRESETASTPLHI